jgi:Fe-S cluster biogenesis protein NfuA
MIRQLEKLFDDNVRPALAAHGGDIELIDVDNNKVYVKMTGGCQGCSSSQATLTDGVERLIKQNFPEIEKVVDLTDHDSGDNPYFK